MIAPRIAVTGFGPLLLKLAMRFALAGMSGNFSEFHGELLYANESQGYEVPVLYIYEQDGSLWIIHRGTDSVYDWLTVESFNETTTPLGTFHGGIFRSATDSYRRSKPYISQHNGPVYFTGHSYGSTIGPVEMILASADFPDKDLNAIGFASFPTMDDTTNKKFREKIVTVVNSDDIVPTISVGNLYQTLGALVPFLDMVPEDAVIQILEQVADTFAPFMPPDVYQELKIVIPQLADAIFAYGHGEQRLIRYVPGHAYQVFPGHPKRLDDCEVDPTQVLNALSVTTTCIADHSQSLYEQAMEELPTDQRYWRPDW
jgi:hypothetical protein